MCGGVCSRQGHVTGVWEGDMYINRVILGSVGVLNTMSRECPGLAGHAEICGDG